FSSKDLNFKVKDKFGLTFILKAYYQGGCWDTTSFRVNVHELPVGTFTTKSSCEGESISVKNTTDTSGRDLSFSWKIDTWTQTAFEPSKVLDTAGKYIVFLSVTDQNSGCTNESNGEIEIYQNPIPTFDVKNACFGEPTTVINTTAHDVSANYFRWHLPTNKPFNKDTFTFTSPVTEAVIGLEYKDVRGCYAIVFDTVEMADVSINITGPTELCENQSGDFIADVSPQNASIKWYLNDFYYSSNHDETIIIASANAGNHVVVGKIGYAGCYAM
ncbi:MAG: hypothetical protein KDC76_14735, partial [Bacteroidetes bacterium]|nr:hypothetical protein [Bacteroidota bacterium]